MFEYKSGFEIDGSATSYNVVVPQRTQLAEVLNYFFTLKIVNKHCPIDITSFIKKKEIKTTIDLNNFSFDTIENILADLETEWIRLDITCVHPDFLFHQVRNELFELSKSRPGIHPKDIISYKNPTISPFYYSYGFTFYVDIIFPKQKLITPNYKPEGLVFNENSLIKNISTEHYNMNIECGPSFIYEYAAYVMTKISKKFPELGIDGGIDCAGGFIDGCTYSCDLYSNEIISLDTKRLDIIFNSLIDSKAIIPQKRSGKYGQDFVDSDFFEIYCFRNLDINDTVDQIILGLLSKGSLLSIKDYLKYLNRLNNLTCLNKHNSRYFSIVPIKILDTYGAIVSTQLPKHSIEMIVLSGIRSEVEKLLQKIE